jgi:serine O-acetyltransferase
VSPEIYLHGVFAKRYLHEKYVFPMQQDSSRPYRELAAGLEKAIQSDHLANIWSGCRMPSRVEVESLLDRMLSVLFPGVFGPSGVAEGDLTTFLESSLATIEATLADFIAMALEFAAHRGPEGVPCEPVPQELAKTASEKAQVWIQALPSVRALLGEDIQAAYEGDPAASSLLEVLLSYPCMGAIATHRLAHVLYQEQVPLLPRMLSEVAHSRTGIDIHPGANIGPGFFIDHGTGVVVGETTVIGRWVKLYQGVTLGALSFQKDDQGNPIKGIKRHPNIGDGVTIYAGATVLGGKTLIGEGSVIGGSCWITSSVPPNTVVMNDRLRQKSKAGE